MTAIANSRKRFLDQNQPKGYMVSGKNLEGLATPGFGGLHQWRRSLQQDGNKCEQVVLQRTLVVSEGALVRGHALGHIDEVQRASDGCIVDWTETGTIWLCHGEPK